MSSLLSSVGLESGGSVPWGTPVPETASGVYLVSLVASPTDAATTRATAPLSKSALADLVAVCSDLTLDGMPSPTPLQIAERINSYWLSDESVLYIGLAGQPLRARVRQYYKTPLGAAKPHKGGWWLKTLSVLADLHVHYAVTSDFKEAEEGMLRTFASCVSEASLARWPAGDPVMPFANLRDADWALRNHRIRGATAGVEKAGPSVPTSRRRGPVSAPLPESPSPASEAAGPAGSQSPDRSQKVTAKDIEAGQVRVPRVSKAVFPCDRGDITVRIRGLELTCRWDPRSGPPERSGVIRIGKAAAAELLATGDVLAIGAVEGVVELN